MTGELEGDEESSSFKDLEELISERETNLGDIRHQVPIERKVLYRKLPLRSPCTEMNSIFCNVLKLTKASKVKLNFDHHFFKACFETLSSVRL